MAKKAAKKAAGKAAPKKDDESVSTFDLIWGSLEGVPEPQRTEMAKEMAEEGSISTGSGVWKPTTAGDKISGIYFTHKQNRSRFSPDDQYHVYGLRGLDENENVVEFVFLSSAVIDREMKKFDLGTWLTVVFTGTTESKEGRNPTKLFRIFPNPVKTEEYQHLFTDEDGDAGLDGAY